MEKDLQNIKILIVENSEDARKFYLDLLKKYNFNVYEASNAKEGIESYKKNLPDIIITDIIMPEMSGFELIAKVKQINKNTSIIIISAFESIEILHQAIDLEVCKFIKKPIHWDKLLNAIEMLSKDIKSKKLIKFQKNLIEKQKKILENRVENEIEKNQEKESLMFQQSRYAQMGEMLSMIAHQWRQPLNAISASAMNIEIENSFGELTEESIESNIKFIHNQIQNMSNIINDFMNFFKVEKESLEFTITSLMKGIEDLIGAQFRSRGIELILNFKEDITLNSYKKEIIHILINLIINSRDAFDDMDIKKNKIVTLNFKDKRDTFEIAIIDNAGGIDENIIDRIFEPYFTTKEQGKGTGIGLYMTRSIIEKNLSGEISVRNIDSKNGKGVCFIVEIPKG